MRAFLWLLSTALVVAASTTRSNAGANGWFGDMASWMASMPGDMASAFSNVAQEGFRDFAQMGDMITCILNGSVSARTFPPVSVPGLSQPVGVQVPVRVTTGRKRIPDADHPFVAPGPTDQRGGCPGLNLMANYGYISRSGITTPTEVIHGMQEMLGFSPDLAALFAAFFFVSTIDITTLRASIGYADARTDGPFTFIFGRAPGLFDRAAHNTYEVDGSVLYTDSWFARGYGAVPNFNLWRSARKIAEANGGVYDINWAANVRWERYRECIAWNPECFWGIKQLLFYAGDNFPNLIAASADESGRPSTATYDVASTFWGIRDNGNGSYAKVPEQLLPGPDGYWYRRSPPLSTVDLAAVLLKTLGMHPVTFGGNQGRPNSFVGLDGEQVSGAGGNPFCLLFQAVDETVPAYLQRYKGAAEFLARMFLAPMLSLIGCQNLSG